ncbi:uncharacterized protein EV420DRAFT_1510297 [Desarmillaria tabescens]|uniref:Uncharacterized protein n=1 Tax=Armillaria tabescens TaxID=1929756 RepID=A0AA39TXN1_ARMTA|nr:uncharacterized protein EV420DRAFT_1510297 [Desarmillaria tabescens]KAK0466169.1 hypothetical protein EV420DRAFT_1510297 [Desarmillaria tabescens]
MPMMLQSQRWRYMAMFAASTFTLLFSMATVFHSVSTHVFSIEESSDNPTYSKYPFVCAAEDYPNPGRVKAFIDNDFPELMPIDLPDVFLTMEESRHYGISGLDDREEWASSAAYGFGYLRLGEEKRRFAIRQMILCNPDLTLEPADMLTRNYEIKRVGATHVCKDWSRVYEEMERNVNATTSRDSDSQQ